MNETLKAIWLTLLQREPTAAEYQAFEASPEKRPYTYAQQKIITARDPGFMSGWNLVDGWDLPRRLNEAKDEVIRVLQPRVDALTKQLEECATAASTTAGHVARLEEENTALRTSVDTYRTQRDELDASLAICQKDLGEARLEIERLRKEPKVITDPADLSTGQLLTQLILRILGRGGDTK